MISAKDISILKSETENSKTESTILKELQTEIKIMIEIIETPETQLLMRNIYKENKQKGVSFLEKMLDGLSSNNYSFI